MANIPSKFAYFSDSCLARKQGHVVENGGDSNFGNSLSLQNSHPGGFQVTHPLTMKLSVIAVCCWGKVNISYCKIVMYKHKQTTRNYWPTTMMPKTKTTTFRTKWYCCLSGLCRCRVSRVCTDGVSQYLLRCPARMYSRSFLPRSPSRLHSHNRYTLALGWKFVSPTNRK